MGFTDYLPVYGAASFFSSTSSAYRPFLNSEMRIGFGGAMLPETGTELFREAIQLLSGSADVAMRFFITGNYDKSLFTDLLSSVQTSSNVTIELRPNIEIDEYRLLASTLDIGLCLKLPSSDIGKTTFPSKVIEIAALGALVCSTSVSDVPLLLDDECALIMRTEEPAELAQLLLFACRDRAGSVRKALAGQRRIKETFSYDKVGNSIVSFLNGVRN